MADHSCYSARRGVPGGAARATAAGPLVLVSQPSPLHPVSRFHRRALASFREHGQISERAGARTSAHRPSCPSDRLDTNARLHSFVPARSARCARLGP
eukprot:3199280-Prymnesium_polylepis.1